MRQQLRKAYQEPGADIAKRALESLAQELERERLGAANSLREGLPETLTVHRLGMPGVLRQTLANTNAMESINSQFRTHAQNVKLGRMGNKSYGGSRRPVASSKTP